MIFLKLETIPRPGHVASDGTFTPLPVVLINSDVSNLLVFKQKVEVVDDKFSLRHPDSKL